MAHRGHGNQVLAAVVHQDQGNASGLLGIPDDAVGEDALLAIAGKGLIAEHILTDAGEEGDLGSEPGGGHGLVRAFPSRRHDELASRDRLAHGRDARAFDHHVGVAAADDHDSRSCHDQGPPTKQGSGLIPAYYPAPAQIEDASPTM